MSLDAHGEGVHPLDRDRDPVSTAFVHEVAAEVAAGFGADLVRMRRASGYSNATSVGEGIAVRVALAPSDMSREAAVVRALPPQVGHPAILGEGQSEGHGWMVTTQVHGDSLHEAWPALAPAQRTAAVHQLWGRARAVHEAGPSLRALVAPHGGYVPATIDAAAVAAGRAELALRLSGAERSRLHGIIQDYFDAAPSVEHVVNHGDLALMNALWDGHEVVSLLDFEFAVLAPVEIDLCRLVGEARLSDDGSLVDSEAGRAAVEIAERLMDPTHGRALLHGAAVLDQFRDLGVWRAVDGTDHVAQDCRPARLLAGLLTAEGGYLEPLLG